MPEKPTAKRPFTVYLLSFLMLFQAIGAIYGGGSFILDPSGSLIKMPKTNLEGTPFSDFLFPGIILFVLLGLLPLLLSYALLVKPSWSWFAVFNIYRHQHWAWGYSVYVGIMLVIWILVQGMMIGFGAVLQFIYALLGGVIIIVAVLPSTKHYYYRW